MGALSGAVCVRGSRKVAALRKLLKPLGTSFVVVALIGVFTVGAAAAVTDYNFVDQVDFSVTEVLASSTTTQCNVALPTVFARSVSTSTGTSTEIGTPHQVPLTGNVTLKTTQDAKLVLDGTTKGPAVARGSFNMTYPADTRHRLKGTFTAVAEVVAAITGADANGPIITTTADGRGFVTASYQKKTSTGWKNTGAQVFANVEFAVPSHDSNTASTTNGTFGINVAPDAGIPVLAAEMTSHC